jgi:hypoxanthine phosphoribosyltransferase
MKSSLKHFQIKILFSEKEIRKKVIDLAEELAHDYKNIYEKERTKFRLVLLGILNGAVPFIGDLARELSKYFPPGTIEIDYMAISSYRGKKSGPIRIDKDTKYPLEGAHVIVVEDIIDTGQTLFEILNLLSKRQTKSLKTCVLVKKARPRNKEVPLDYIGFLVPADKWLIGYGLDFEGKGRELPFIGYLSEF